MPELRLQSDMLNNMSLAQRRAMMQRGMIWQNQQIGAFEGEEYYGGSREGNRTNPYLRYYAQMQRDAMEYQRRVALQQQMMQRQMAVQQQQYMLDQQEEEMKVKRSQEDADRQILEIRKLKDEVRKRKDLTQGQIDKITSDLDRKEYGLTGESEPLVKKVQRDSNFFFPSDFPNKELRNKPIPETYQVNTETGEETLLGTSGESTFNSLRAATEQNRRFDFDQEKENNKKALDFAKALTPSPAEKKKADDDAEAKKPWRWEEIGDDTKTRVIPKESKSKINKDSDAEAADWYAGNQKQDSDVYAGADGEPGRQSDMDKQFHKEALDILRNDSLPDPNGVREYRERARKKRFTDDFT